jgi:hypothetical protein
MAGNSSNNICSIIATNRMLLIETIERRYILIGGLDSVILDNVTILYFDLFSQES